MRRLIAAVALSGCAPFVSPDVVDRRVHGETQPGRFVDETAYEVSLTAAIAEAAGDREKAEGAYLLLTRLDPDSADPWSRLALLRCQRGVAAKFVDDAFARAEAAEPGFAPTHLRRARCQASRGDRVAARRSAMRALELEPSSPETSLFLVDVARADGDAAEADRLLRGLAARAPAAAVRAAARPVVGVRDVDRALLRGRFDDATELSGRAGVSLGALSLRAAALGRLAFARALSSSLAANPGDLDAAVALFASEPSRRVPLPPFGTLSPLAVAVAKDTLARRGLGDIADALVVPPSDDPLVAALAGRR